MCSPRLCVSEVEMKQAAISMTLNEHDTGGGDLTHAGDVFRLLWLSTVAIWGSVVGTATLMRNGSFLAAACRPFAFRTRWLWCLGRLAFNDPAHFHKESGI